MTTGRFGLIAEHSARWLLPVVYAISAAAFIVDLLRANTLAYGIIYAPLVATAVFHKKRSGLWILSGVVCLMVVIGTFLPRLGDDLPDIIGNRVLSILAVGATALFVHHARNTQERLAAETRRAEAAERMKTDVLTNLSQEIRPPLHAMLGVMTLTMASGSPGQREALRRVRGDTTRLLATIDNLLDLTQIEEHTLRPQTIDLAAIARDATERARAAANERQVKLALNPQHHTGVVAAIGDSWALRRILDNLLANAVRVTPPGGTVSVSVDRDAGMVTASVSDTGRGLSPELARSFRDNAPETERDALPHAGGTGLALSRRLALAMNARMTASNQPGLGATVSLSLPAA